MFQISLKLLFHLSLLGVHLSSVEVLHLLTSQSFLFSFLLLSYCELFISDLPELCELFLLLVLLVFLNLLSLNLLLPASLNSLLHLKSPSLLFLKESVSFLFSLSNLLVQNLILSVLNTLQDVSLVVNHTLSCLLLFRKLLLFTILLKLV
jgi:hypothetical protein